MQLYTVKGLKRWSAIRARGRGRFFLVHGVLYNTILSWLLPCALLWSMFGWQIGPVALVLFCLASLASGLFFAQLTWWINERRYPTLSRDELSMFKQRRLS